MATIQPQHLQQSQVIEDRSFYYAQNFVAMALNFRDAVKEMHDPRLFRLWELKMLYFKEAGRNKYASEDFCFQADQYALLSDHEAYQQFWNRGCN